VPIVDVNREPFSMPRRQVPLRDLSPEPLGLSKSPDGALFLDGRLFVPPALQDNR
jgi:hypothetical protein